MGGSFTIIQVEMILEYLREDGFQQVDGRKSKATEQGFKVAVSKSGQQKCKIDRVKIGWNQVWWHISSLNSRLKCMFETTRLHRFHRKTLPQKNKTKPKTKNNK